MNRIGLRTTLVPRALRDALLAALGFAAGALALRPLVPEADGDLGAKLEHFTAHADQYDALFLGASRVYRGIDPLRVDAALAEHGVASRSFNLGGSAVWAFEQDELLERVLALRPARLRTIYYGGGAVGASTHAQNALQDDVNVASERGVRWHTPRATLVALHALAVTGLDVPEKLAIGREHVVACLRNVGNVGAARRLARRALESPREAAARERIGALIAKRAGYLGLQELRKREYADEMAEYLADPALFAARVDGIRAENALPIELDEVDVELYRAQQRRAAAAGVELVYLTMPAREGCPERVRLHERGVLPELLHFDDPERYPELFLLEHRFDPGHFNDDGTRLFSRVLADAILARRAARGEP